MLLGQTLILTVLFHTLIEGNVKRINEQWRKAKTRLHEADEVRRMYTKVKG